MLSPKVCLHTSYSPFKRKLSFVCLKVERHVVIHCTIRQTVSIAFGDGMLLGGEIKTCVIIMYVIVLEKRLNSCPITSSCY